MMPIKHASDVPNTALLELQVQTVYRPFAQAVLAVQRNKGGRILVGIAGAPGSGKSTFAVRAADEINREAGKPCAVVVGLDGWHYPNQLLEEKFICRNGKMMLLKAFKGVPESFDVEAFIHFLSRLQSEPGLTYPVYDRALHDPQPDAGHLSAEYTIVLVEGNYLLLETFPWQQIKPFLDLTCFINAGESLRWRDLIKRHMRGGKAPLEALKHIARVDVPNTLRIGSPQADILLERKKDYGFCNLQIGGRINP